MSAPKPNRLQRRMQASAARRKKKVQPHTKWYGSRVDHATAQGPNDTKAVRS